MSKLNLVVFTLCVTVIVIFLFVFPLYISLSLIFPSVLFFLYTDYKKQQSSGREQSGPSHAVVGLGLPSFQTTREFIGPLFRSFNLRMQKYYIGLVNQASGNADVSVPSHSRPRSFSTHPRKFNASSTGVRNVSSLDENRLISSTFYRSNGNHSFDVGLSPIRLIDNSPTSDLRNLRISDRPRPLESSSNLRTRNQSLMSLKSPLGDTSSTRKPPSTRASPKNIQSIAGPLLASTRYNLSLDTVAYTDVTSSGLSSRVVKYASNQPATHQQQYSGPGQFPTVQLAKSPHVPLVSRTQVVGRTPVRVRIAPPEFSERRNYITPSPTQTPVHLSSSTPTSHSSLDRLKEITRPDRLQDAPRKRIHAQLGEVDDEAAKKQRVGDTSRQAESPWNNGNVEDTTTSKRVREESPKEDSETKRTRNNEIFSSLSSSRNLTTRTNKRKQSTEEWSQSGSHVPAGKQAKTSVPSPDVPSTSKAEVQTPLSKNVEMETAVKNSKSTPNLDQTHVISRHTPSVEEKLPSITKMTAVPRKDLYRPTGDISGWVTTEAFLESETTLQEKAKLAGEDLKNQRELDAKRRLSSMMFIVGEQEDISQKVFTPTSNSTSTAKPASSAPSSSARSPTSILSSPAFPNTSTSKSSEKHVHFAENLTQIKTFTPLVSNPCICGGGGGGTQPLTGLFGAGSLDKSPGQLSSSQVPGGGNGDKSQETSGPSFSFGTPKTSSDSSSTAKLGTGSPSITPGLGMADGTTKSEGVPLGGSILSRTESPGFSFGSNVTTASTSLPSYSVDKSSLGPTTPASTSLVHTGSTPVFGQSLPESSSTVSTSIQPSGSTPVSSTTSGFIPTSSPMFGFKAPNSTIAVTTTQSQAATISPAQSSKSPFGSVPPATFGGTTQHGFSGLVSSSTEKEKAASVPSFGTPITSVSSSLTTTTSTGFGFPVTPTVGGFGVHSTSGSSTSQTPTSTATAGVFGTSSAPTVAFNTQSTPSAASMFSAPTMVSASNVFGTPTAVSASNVFGTPTAVSAGTGFSTPSTVSTTNVFGTPTTTSDIGAFGTAVSSSGFGTPTTLSSSAFGTPTTSTPSVFGKPVMSTPSVFGTPTTVSTASVFGATPTVSASGGFGTPSTQPSGLFGSPSTIATSVFGTTPTMSAGGGYETTMSTTAGSTFGTPSTTPSVGGFGAPSTTNLFTFRSTNTTPNQPVSFGSTQPQATTAQTSFGGFGTSTSQIAKPVAQGGFSFGGSASTNTSASNMFGAKSDTPTFGMASQSTTDSGNSQGFKIDFSQTNKLGTGNTLFSSAAPTSSVTGGSNLTDASKQTNLAQNTFQFGANSAKPFAFGASSGNENVAPNAHFSDPSSVAVPLPSSTQSTPTIFGQSAFGTPSTTTASISLQKPSGLFSFGSGSTASQQPTNAFTFGAAATNTAQPGGFAFGAAPTQGSQPKPAGGFGFGSSTTPAQTTQAGSVFGQSSQSQPFQFGASSMPTGGFNFGSSASSTPTPAFGTGTSSSFQMGSAPQPLQQGMFSIGSGSSAPRARAARLMRRQR